MLKKCWERWEQATTRPEIDAARRATYPLMWTNMSILTRPILTLSCRWHVPDYAYWPIFWWTNEEGWVGGMAYIRDCLGIDMKKFRYWKWLIGLLKYTQPSMGRAQYDPSLLFVWIFGGGDPCVAGTGSQEPRKLTKSPLSTPWGIDDHFEIFWYWSRGSNIWRSKIRKTIFFTLKCLCVGGSYNPYLVQHQKFPVVPRERWTL